MVKHTICFWLLGTNDCVDRCNIWKGTRVERYDTYTHHSFAAGVNGICLNCPCNITATLNAISQVFWLLTQHVYLKRYFDCSCRRCSDPTECGSFISAVRCFKDCKGESSQVIMILLRKKCYWVWVYLVDCPTQLAIAVFHNKYKM